MLHPHPGLSHIPVMTVDPVERDPAQPQRVEAEVRRAALSQLLKGGPLAESLHVVLVLVVAALVWDSQPRALTLGWVGAVTAAAALRTWWRLGLSRRTASPEEAMRGVRLTVAGVGLTWGFGAAAAIPALGLDEAALILVVLAGMVAGATGTLVGDRRSFRYLLVTVLAPLPVGILLQGHSRPHLLATLLIALFAWGMDRVHQRTYRTFADRVRAAVLLESSTQELARQHAYLDALIASTPVAIAVLDNQRSVRSVNPAFETLFGYSAAEVVGAKIDALIVPAALQSESSDLEAQARSGETVRVEVERMRKDGRHIQVRLSAAAVKATAEGALVALYEDISDRKAAEEAMRAARDLAERVARAPGPDELDRQRHQVHRAGRGRRLGGRGRLPWRPDIGAVSGPRHGDRDRGGAAGYHFPGVHAGRHVHDPPVRGDRSRPRHLPQAGDAHGGPAVGHERGGPRQRVQLHPAPPSRDVRRRHDSRPRSLARWPPAPRGGRQRDQPAHPARHAGRRGRGGSRSGARGRRAGGAESRRGRGHPLRPRHSRCPDARSGRLRARRRRSGRSRARGDQASDPHVGGPAR